MKFAFVSHVLPPSWSGQAMVIHRLLRDLSPDSYCLISQQTSAADLEQNNYSHKLPGRYYHLPPDWQIPRGSRFGVQTINVPVGVWLRARRVAGILRRERCGAVVAASGDLYDLPAAYLASRMTGLPFYPYYFDYYSYQSWCPISRWFARRMEPLLLRGAAQAIVPNEMLRDDLRRRYGVDSVVIRNPCDLSAYEGALDEMPARPRGERRIVYTGAVSEAHFDAFRNLVAAVNSLGRPDVRLHLYTAQSPEHLAARGISGPVVFHEHQPATAIPAIQRQSDVLFLPLAFASPYPAIIKTSAPGKLGEYLAAGRPILAHAPADSFVAWYIRQHECGLIVDENDPARLASALARLLNDVSLWRNFCTRARAQAQAEFSVPAAQVRFAEVLQLARAR